MCMTERVEGTWHDAFIHVHSLDFYWEKHDGKTAGSSKLESPGTDMLTWVRTATNVNILVTF